MITDLIWRITATSALLALATTPALAQTLVDNGSFETPALTPNTFAAFTNSVLGGWLSQGGIGSVYIPSGYFYGGPAGQGPLASDGAQYMLVNNNLGGVTLSQTVTLAQALPTP